MNIIQSLTNPKIKKLIKLRDDKKLIETENMFFIEGINLVNEALKNNLVSEIFTLIENLHHINHIDEKVFVINEQIANKLSLTKNNQGIFATCKIETKPFNPNKNVLLLDNIQDPGNMGTMLRSAISFDFTNVIASKNSVSFFNEKVIRSTQGTIFKSHIKNVDLKDKIFELKKENYIIIGTVLNEKSLAIKELKILPESKIALLVGNEGQGISEVLKPLVDINVVITMSNEVESLNVAIAASILMHKIKDSK
ncbi:TrmH family RNA methyltransferase [Mesoplasma corruscae]|uniref:RNA methyltransferase, TrmH family n=1 Tax=Mesoplasma corruscae TaxID=216874 RepID=A0A2S5RGF7_9MOLU|nr:RNA methyltransferase [Mesoplasma corruscae]PPE06416.1 RNA methyltransferase, TrmH family [Mesoplasma corruscae]